MNILLPVDEQFIEHVAKAVGKDRLHREAAEILQAATGLDINNAPSLDAKFDREFERLWQSDEEECVWNRENYRADAIAAINQINLLLLTMLP